MSVGIADPLSHFVVGLRPSPRPFGVLLSLRVSPVPIPPRPSVGHRFERVAFGGPSHVHDNPYGRRGVLTSHPARRLRCLYAKGTAPGSETRCVCVLRAVSVQKQGRHAPRHLAPLFSPTNAYAFAALQSSFAGKTRTMGQPLTASPATGGCVLATSRA